MRMTQDDSSDESRDHPSQDDSASMSTQLLALPPPQIALFKAIIESYDNLATLRTEDPHRHHLRLYFASASSDTINALLDSLVAEFSITRLPG